MLQKVYILILVLIASLVFSQTDFKLGVQYYNQRAENAVGTTAEEKNIDLAIQHFEQSLQVSAKEETVVMLLKSYYFKGAFTRLTNDEKKEVYNKGKLLGEKMIKQFPQSAGILHWYIADLGKWAEAFGKVTAAKEGIADKLKEHCEQLIELDPNYRDGGGYRILGAVHFEAPYIPFFLTWPSNEEAVRLLKLSREINKMDPNTNLYLAKALHKEGEKEQAIKILEETVARPPRPEELVEDRYNIGQAQALLKQYQ